MNCEQIRIAAMALADGETPLLPRAAAEAHLAECAECRHEIAALRELAAVWEVQTRRTHAADVWPRIESRIVRRSRHWLPALVAMLVVFKAIELAADRSLGTWAQLVPLLLAGAAFAWMRQNPFQIKTELESQEESL